jgi:hypothetical protein
MRHRLSGQAVALVAADWVAGERGRILENPILFFKQIAMCACSLQAQRLITQSINQKPIRFDMAITGMLPVSGQGVISMSRFKRLILCKEANNPLEFIQIFSPLGDPFQIP